MNSIALDTKNGTSVPQDFGIYEDANQALFGGPGGNRIHTRSLAYRTQTGQSNVATLMGSLSQGKVEGEWAAMDTRLLENSHRQLDLEWMDITGQVNLLNNTLVWDFHTGNVCDEEARSDQCRAD